MLRITTNKTGDSLVVRLEGKLAGPWVDELEKCIQSREAEKDRCAVRLDLCGVTFVDDRGKELLRGLRRRGAAFVATGCLMRATVAELADRSRE